MGKENLEKISSEKLLTAPEVIYEEDLKKDFYTKSEVFWGERKSLKLSDDSLYIYHTTLRVTEDVIEVYDFEGGLGDLTDFSIAKDEPEYKSDINGLLGDIEWLKLYQDNMDFILFTKRDRRQWRKKFFENFAQITSELMDLCNAISDI